MKLQALCRRTTWEIVRDPLNLAFGLGFPLVLLLLLSAIQANVPVDLFAIDRLTPGISVFGLAFIALFSATLVARDRESALLQRLYTAPLTAGDFIFGYVLPLVPMAAVQAAVCYLAAVPLGLTVSVRMLWAVLLDLPAALLFIGLGLLCGSVMNVKQVGSICGALLTNLTAWLSGTWFDLELVGGAFQRIAYALPFVHAVELDRAALSGDWASVMPHLWWVLAYAAAALAARALSVIRGVYSMMYLLSHPLNSNVIISQKRDFGSTKNNSRVRRGVILQKVHVSGARWFIIISVYTRARTFAPETIQRRLLPCPKRS